MRNIYNVFKSAKGRGSHIFIYVLLIKFILIRITDTLLTETFSFIVLKGHFRGAKEK